MERVVDSFGSNRQRWVVFAVSGFAILLLLFTWKEFLLDTQIDVALSVASGSATSGRAFTGKKLREFSAQRVFETTVPTSNSKFKPAAPNCKQWIVLTTIFEPSDAVKDFGQLQDWCTVVVADKKGLPASGYEPQLTDRVKYLTVKEQEKLTFHIMTLTPWNHFARKNVGFLYAIAHGAEIIFDVDDDNRLLEKYRTKFIVPPEFKPTLVAEVDTNETSFNPYPVFGAPQAWPRGFPLKSVRKSLNFNYVKYSNTSTGLLFNQVPNRSIAIYQSLANHDPDVDAIYRLVGAKLPFDFSDSELSQTKPFAVYPPAGTLTPYNAQATLHHRTAFFGLLLPMTVHGRVSDIWRSYITQRLLWDVGARVAFTYPLVEQLRNAHDYLRDLDSEQALYTRADAMVEFLTKWQSDLQSVPARLEALTIELYERGFLEKDDVVLTQVWIQDLLDLGYVFPKLCSVGTFDKPFGPSAKGAAVTVVDGQDNSQMDWLLKTLPLLSSNLKMLSAQKLPLLIFILNDKGQLDSSVEESIQKVFAPSLSIEIYASTINYPNRNQASWTFTSNKFREQFASYELYRHPALRTSRFSNIILIDPGTQPLPASDVNLLERLKTNKWDGLVLSDPSAKIDSSVTLDAAVQLFASAHKLPGQKNSRTTKSVLSVYALEPFLKPLYSDYVDSIELIQGVYDKEKGWTANRITESYLLLVSQPGRVHFQDKNEILA